ncbi:MAG TPA: hypothetical protein VFG04_03160 [Planctomycetaceae bacterium]|jgi:hypothetical protein|nr:hypothetical protein [Planctomycetaceae bacterium]
MATRAAEHNESGLRVPLAIVVLVCTTLAIAILASVSYCFGRARHGELHFFVWWAPPTIDEASAVCPVEYALRTEDKHDVIFVGDSACRTGFDPARFERLTGLNAFSLASLRGIGAFGFLITAKAYLIHHPKPAGVVLCVTPICFEADPALVGGTLSERFTANYGPEVAEVVPFVDRVVYFSKRGAWSAFPQGLATHSNLHGQDVRDLPLSGYKAETYHTLQQKMQESRGFFPLPGSHGPPRGVDVPTGKLVRPDWDQGIRRLAEICGAADVALLIQFAPVASEVAKARDFGPLEAWSHELEATYPRTTVARPIVNVYDAACMWDCIHLNAAGVEKFAPVVAENVQFALAK